MLTFDVFRAILEAALANKSAVAISRSAGLSERAIADIRHGSLPNLERASRLLDALGLELHVRRKGEVIDKEALNDAIQAALDVLGLPHETGDSVISEEALEFAAATYKYFGAVRDPMEAEHPDRDARWRMLAKEYSDCMAARIVKVQAQAAEAERRDDPDPTTSDEGQ